jgi:hypothetical protein
MGSEFRSAAPGFPTDRDDVAIVRARWPSRIRRGYNLGSQAILLWHPEELVLALQKKRIVPFLELKYRARVEDGIHDANTAFLGAL